MSVVPTCGIPVVICRHVPAAIQLIFKYIQGNDETPNTYLILTVREVLLFQLRDRNGEPGVVKTASLFDGDDEGAPRREGARLLLQAITGPNIHVNSGGLGNHYLDRSLVEYLQSQPPFEQDISLHAMATSPLERRRLACSLCIGLKNYDAFESFQLYEGDQDAQRGTVVNQIWFDCFSGVAYNCGPPIAGKDHSTAYNTDEGHANDKRDENSNAGDDDTKHNGDKSKNDDHVNKYLRAANLQVYHGRLPDTSYKVKGDNNVIKVVYAKKGNIAKEACNAKRVDNADNSNVADNASGTVHGGDDEQTKIDHDMEELVKPGLSAICTKEWLKN
ncbi:hypothetical protein RRF57_007685 [Xylaria bambusicola]|uniref:Uncharacterized protein n=1 Tax=Xylaria bambusicola TaxID=326684 RepID=A0AAN7ZAL0_9PEZI